MEPIFALPPAIPFLHPICGWPLRPSGPPSFALGEGRFPVAAVEQQHRLHRCRIEIVEAAGVDAVLVRVGARHVKSVDATSRAEGVPCRAGVEPIGRHLAVTAQQLEILGCHGNVQYPLLCADRAVALADRGRCEIGPYPEPDPPAVTAAFVSLQHPDTPYALSSTILTPRAECGNVSLPGETRRKGHP